ncbi:MAG: response regulator transcription factor [Candidatus Sumerlaeota bacterium]|nr:response regulator transcription factor [Candidatus Sumerlaeota bacterium]
MRLLLIEDSKRLQTALAVGLRRSGWAVDVCGDGEEGLWLAESNEYDVIVLDLMLPKIDGLTVLQRLRAQGRNTHILILTAKDTVEDRVRGLQLGADDYLIKPFAFAELLARTQALARRAYGVKRPRLAIGDLVLDTAARTVVRAGAAIPLAPREYALLELLARRRGEVVSRTEIEEHIYDERAQPMSNVVDAAVYALRRKIGRPGASSLIQTRRGMGYILQEAPACGPSEES